MEKLLTYNRNLLYLLFLALFCSAFGFGQNSTTEQRTIKTVVIDAGHGGKDPGCHGASANEKTVCLNIALKLGESIKKKYPGIKVIYTRDKDVFVEYCKQIESRSFYLYSRKCGKCYSVWR
jgi:N-acetylmuramoyl-L-alanine amidase